MLANYSILPRAEDGSVVPARQSKILHLPCPCNIEGRVNRKIGFKVFVAGRHAQDLDLAGAQHDHVEIVRRRLQRIFGRQIP